jgi:hypothetical protein
MSAAIANAIADGSLNRMMADPGKGKPPDDEEIKANFDIVVAHAAMLIPSVRRKELAELKDSMVDDEFMNFGTGEPVFVRQIQIWRKDLGKAELIAAHLLDGGFCGSGGATVRRFSSCVSESVMRWFLCSARASYLPFTKPPQERCRKSSS